MSSMTDIHPDRLGLSFDAFCRWLDAEPAERQFTLTHALPVVAAYLDQGDLQVSWQEASGHSHLLGADGGELRINPRPRWLRVWVAALANRPGEPVITAASAAAVACRLRRDNRGLSELDWQGA